MKKRHTLLALSTCLYLTSTLLAQQEQAPAPATVEGVKGVKQDAVTSVKKVEDGVTTGTKSNVEGVNKVNGIDTINGVKADGRTVVPVPPPPVTAVPPPPVMSAGGTVTPAATTPAGTGDVTTGTQSVATGVNKIDGVDTIDGVKANGRKAVAPIKPVAPPPVIVGGGSIQSVNGVTGINTARMQNLEAALLIKDGTGDRGAKAKAAAAGLGGPPGKAGLLPKEDCRAGFQEFEKLTGTGS